MLDLLGHDHADMELLGIQASVHSAETALLQKAAC